MTKNYRSGLDDEKKCLKTDKSMDNRLSVKLFRVSPEKNSDIPLPRYMTPGSSGMDLYAAPGDKILLARGEISLIPTGFAIALPNGYEAQIRPRSGLSVKHGIGIINSPGTIDADFRGEIKIALINLGQNEHVVKRGDRIAQMVIQRVCRARLEEITGQLDKTERGEGGFGHTGL